MEYFAVAFLVLICCLQVLAVPIDVYINDKGVITKLEELPSNQNEEISGPTDDKKEERSDGSDGSKSFEYSFSVKNRDGKLFYERLETRDGSLVKGSYTVLLPDGRIQVVEYIADKENGFVPMISYNQDNPFD